MPDTSGEFRPREIVRTLNEEGVEYVVIGGLVAALNRLGARIRTAGDAVPTKIDGAFPTAMPLMLNWKPAQVT